MGRAWEVWARRERVGHKAQCSVEITQSCSPSRGSETRDSGNRDRGGAWGELTSLTLSSDELVVRSTASAPFFLASSAFSAVEVVAITCAPRYLPSYRRRQHHPRSYPCLSQPTWQSTRPTPPAAARTRM